MHADVTSRIAAVAVLLLMSAFFSGTESALFSLTRVQRERMRQSGRQTERIILSLLERPRRLISSILLGNELVNISIATLIAAIVERLFRSVLSQTELTVVSTVIALPALLLFGEITPKSVALRAAEGWARLAARPIALVARVVAPVRWAIQGVADGVLWLLGQRPRGTPTEALKEAEFRALVDVGSEEGEVQAAEQRLIHNVFEFGDRAVGDIMTPMERVVSFPYEWSLQRILEAVQKSRYSRLPIYRRARDNVVGILFAKDLVGLARGHASTRTLGDLVMAPYYVPKATKCDFLLRQMQRRKTHMAVIVNEYGRTIGLCTMEDLLEELFGEIADEKEGPPGRRTGEIPPPPAGEDSPPEAKP
ncbi:MAG: HlyC/CorC family transporter [Deltaproteobacteria bacterium]|nr:HlyC/CorC family transporter [Deltaproteobacteria bacterium]